MSNPFQQFDVVVKSSKSQSKPAVKVLSTKGRFELSQEVYKQLGEPARVAIQTNYNSLKKAVDENAQVVKDTIKANSELKGKSTDDVLQFMVNKYFVAKIVKSDNDGAKVGINLQFSNAAAWDLIGGNTGHTISFDAKVENKELVFSFENAETKAIGLRK